MSDYKILIREFETDYRFFKVVDLTDPVIEKAKLVIDRHYLKSLDSIHLASAVLLKNDIDHFVTCDQKLIRSGKKEGLKIINPDN